MKKKQTKSSIGVKCRKIKLFKPRAITASFGLDGFTYT